MSARRSYRLGKRESAVQQTRQQIVDAAIDEFAAVGVANTSMQAVARRADLAPGTVTYHFSDRDALAAAVVRHLWETVQLPGPEALPSQQPVNVRVAALITLLYEFYARSATAYQFFRRNEDHPAVVEGVRQFQDSVAALFARAFDGSPVSPRTITVISALSDASFYTSLTLRGLDTAAAAEAATQLADAALGHSDHEQPKN